MNSFSFFLGGGCKLKHIPAMDDMPVILLYYNIMGSVYSRVSFRIMIMQGLITNSDVYKAHAVQ